VRAAVKAARTVTNLGMELLLRVTNNREDFSMFRRFTKRRAMVTLGAIAAVAVVSAALAAFTSSGSGTGSASVGSDTPFVLHGTSGSTLYPGQSSTVTFTVDNNGTGNQQLGTIYLSGVTACNTAFVAGACPTGHEILTCESVDPGNAADASANDFYMADVAVNHDYANGTGQTVTPTGTLTMNDVPSQDSCKSANLQLHFSTR
jgi:hypothetical protein